MAHEFVILIKGELVTFTDYADIPDDFEHVIKFAPEFPKGPHTPEQHEELGQWNGKLQALMEKERANARRN